MNNQEFFTKTVIHLRAQGRKAADIMGSCMYRTDMFGKLLKCAIGCHIPDHVYRKAFEGCTITFLLTPEDPVYSPELKELFRGVDLPLMVAMQRLHDEYFYESGAEVIAARYGLVYTPPNIDFVGPEALEVKEGELNVERELV